jgi:hypothetical protein
MAQLYESKSDHCPKSSRGGYAGPRTRCDMEIRVGRPRARRAFSWPKTCCWSRRRNGPVQGGNARMIRPSTQMFRAKPPARRSLTVTVVCRDPSTIQGLEVYLARRVTCCVALALAQASKQSMASDCVVLYPDGFPARSAQRFANRLVDSPTVSLVVIVSAIPAEYQSLGRARSLSNRLIVLSAPAWPWTIFATIESSLPTLRREPSRLC